MQFAVVIFAQQKPYYKIFFEFALMRWEKLGIRVPMAIADRADAY